MRPEVYRYTFPTTQPPEDLEITLLLAILATESLHGEVAVRLDAKHFLDAERRVCVIDAGSVVGRDLNRLFAGFLRRDFGDDFHVERVDAVPQREAQVVSKSA
jgi:hypothetical protein